MEEHRSMSITRYKGNSLCIFCGSPGVWVIKTARSDGQGGVSNHNHVCRSCYGLLKKYFRPSEEEADEHL